jgi:hypothetical protein
MPFYLPMIRRCASPLCTSCSRLSCPPGARVAADGRAVDHVAGTSEEGPGIGYPVARIVGTLEERFVSGLELNIVIPGRI